MIQTNAGIVAATPAAGWPARRRHRHGHRGQRRRLPAAGRRVRHPGQHRAVGRPPDRRGRASPAVTIGYPPFLGIFVGTGSDSSPQDQAQQGQQQYGSGGSQGCSASNAGLAAPTAIAPVSSGVLVDGTICGGPAAQAGLTGGAVITAINGQAIGSPDQLGVVLARFHPGDTISVTWVSPAGQRTTSSIRLTAGPPQ